MRKKAIIRLFGGEIVWSYLPQRGFVATDVCEFLDPAARAGTAKLSQIKTIAFVRDFNLSDSVDPERIGRRQFVGRPRGEGLWLRLGFRDQDVLEGLAHFDIGFVDNLLDDRGVTVTPPDARSNTQRIFVPRAALATAQVLGLIGPPARRKALEQAGAALQGGLFGE